MAEVDTEVRAHVVTDLDVTNWSNPDVERRQRLDREHQEERVKLLTARQRADEKEVERFYDEGEVVPKKELGQNDADREQYLNANEVRPMNLDPNGTRAVTTPGSRLCYICLRGFPTTAELTAHIGLNHHGRTHWDVARAMAADEKTLLEDVPEELRDLVRAWRDTSRDAAEDRKRNASKRAVGEVHDDAKHLDALVTDPANERTDEELKEVRDEIKKLERRLAADDHDPGDEVEVDRLGERERNLVMEQSIRKELAPSKIVAEESFHDRAENPYGEPLEEARARLKSEATSVAIQEALFDQDMRPIREALRAQDIADARYETDHKDVLVRVGDENVSSKLAIVEERPGETINPKDRVVIKKATTALTTGPDPRDKHGDRVPRLHPDPVLREKLELEEEYGDHDKAGKGADTRETRPKRTRRYMERQQNVQVDHHLTSNERTPSKGEPVPEGTPSHQTMGATHEPQSNSMLLRPRSRMRAAVPLMQRTLAERGPLEAPVPDQPLPEQPTARQVTETTGERQPGQPGQARRADATVPRAIPAPGSRRAQTVIEPQTTGRHTPAARKAVNARTGPPKPASKASKASAKKSTTTAKGRPAASKRK